MAKPLYVRGVQERSYHGLHLARQPDVIRVEETDDVSGCGCDSGIQRGGLPGIVLINGLYGIALQDAARIVGRSIVDHNDFDWHVRLRQHTVQRRREKPPVVVIGDDDSHQRPGGYHPSTSRKTASIRSATFSGVIRNAVARAATRIAASC